jgi:hypothetical protein
VFDYDKHKLGFLGMLILGGIETCFVHELNISFVCEGILELFIFQSHKECINHGLDVLV